MPQGVTQILVELWGAGGGDGDKKAFSNGGGGGGSGAYASALLNVSQGTLFSIFVGRGGFDACGTANDGEAGFSTIITPFDSSFILAAGGGSGGLLNGTGGAGGTVNSFNIVPDVAHHGNPGGVGDQTLLGNSALLYPGLGGQGSTVAGLAIGGGGGGCGGVNNSGGMFIGDPHGQPGYALIRW